VLNQVPRYEDLSCTYISTTPQRRIFEWRYNYTHFYPRH